MIQQISLKEAKQKAGRYCALKERSSQELKEKAVSWGLSEEDVHELLQLLREEGYINDQRFADAFCHDKFEFNSWGKQKIKAHISKHRLSSSIIAQALARIDNDSYESRLSALCQKKWDSLVGKDLLTRKQKTVNYLGNKGFELDLIWKIVGEIENKRL